MNIKINQQIYIKNRKEADIIWKILIRNGFRWMSGLKEFRYYNKLPILIFVHSNNRLCFDHVNQCKKNNNILTIENFLKNFLLIQGFQDVF